MFPNEIQRIVKIVNILRDTDTLTVADKSIEQHIKEILEFCNAMVQVYSLNNTAIAPLEQIINACSDDVLSVKQKNLEKTLKTLKDKKSDAKQNRNFMEISKKLSESTENPSKLATIAHNYARSLVIDFCKQSIEIGLEAHHKVPENLINILQNHCYHINPTAKLEEMLRAMTKQSVQLIEFVQTCSTQLAILKSLELQMQGISESDEVRMSISVRAQSILNTPIEKCSSILMESDHLTGPKWKRKKCQVKDDVFLLFKEDVSKPILSIPIITCSIQDVELPSRRFKVLASSVSRKLKFMCETENEFRQWLEVFSHAQQKSMQTALSLAANDPNPKQNRLSTISRRDEIIEAVRLAAGNDECCDCRAKSPDWIVINLGILVCIECCGVHRELGVHLSKTQSLEMDKIEAEVLLIAVSVGNKLFNQVFEECIVDQTYPELIRFQGRKSAADQKYRKRLFVQPTQISHFHVELAIVGNDLLKILKAHALGFDFLEIDPDSVTSWNALFKAVEHYDETRPEILQFILLNLDSSSRKSTSISIDFTDIDGNTALHIAVKKNKPRAVKCLINHNANYFILNCEGLSPINFAQKFGYKECLEHFHSASPSDKRSFSTGSIESERKLSRQLRKNSYRSNQNLRPNQDNTPTNNNNKPNRHFFTLKKSIGF